jgi:F420-dependent oxidoreductase-like protein
MASEALLTNQAIGGRLILGLGLSHRPIVETKWGQPFVRPVRLLSEYLQILVPLLDHREVDFMGEMLGARMALRADGAPRPTVLVAAMGPQTLRVAGRYSDGTDTWMTGPRTLAELTVPTLTAAAEAARRPAPIVAAGLPICVTHDTNGGRARVAATYGHHATFPTYRTMLDREGMSGPEDLALVGDEDTVLARLRELASVGVTDFIASPFGTPDEIRTTRATLRAIEGELAR